MIRTRGCGGMRNVSWPWGVSGECGVIMGDGVWNEGVRG
ncbi:hypothetical protein AVEN_257749-1, partial [Araneus ventricosus]